MKIIKNIAFFISALTIPAGFIFRLLDILGWGFLMLFGFSSLFVIYTIKTIKSFIIKVPKSIFLLQIMMVLMSFSLFTRYLYYILGDYPSLVIVPLYIYFALFYIIKEKEKVFKLTFVSILYLLLSLPLIGFDFDKSPRQYIPQQWYNRYDVAEGVPMKIPYGFEFYETEQLSIEAFELRKEKKYLEAIHIYKQARILEPQNPRLLFDLSETYARVNNLETAVALLDTAIIIDNQFAGLYNNRGLLFYKLKQNDKAIHDYQKAIELDSTQVTFYTNLALVYYHEDLFTKACEQIEKAEQLGFKIENKKEIKQIKEKSCK